MSAKMLRLQKLTVPNSNCLKLTLESYPLRGYILGFGAPGITLMEPLEWIHSRFVSARDNADGASGAINVI